MSEIIVDDESGLLVPPKNPQAIATAIIKLADDSNKVASLAEKGRQRVLDFLSHDRILPLQIASYERAIAAAKQRTA